MFRRLICWWRTGHRWAALGSQMRHSGPHFIYMCEHCHAMKWVRWP